MTEKENILRKIRHLENMTTANGASKYEEQTAKEKIVKLKSKLKVDTVKMQKEIDDEYERWEAEMKIKRAKSRKQSQEMLKRDKAQLNRDFVQFNMKQHKCQWGDLNEERMDNEAKFSNKAFI